MKNTVRSIIEKSKDNSKVNEKTFDSIKKLDKQKLKYGFGISRFLDLQDSNNIHKKKSIMEHIYDTEFTKQQNEENFLSKDIIMKMRAENFKNSVYISTRTGAKSKVWKPDKMSRRGKDPADV